MARVSEGKYGVVAGQEARILSCISSALQGNCVAKHKSDLSLSRAAVHSDAGGSIKHESTARDGKMAMQPDELLPPFRPSYAVRFGFLGKINEEESEIMVELYADVRPKMAMNFRVLCIGANGLGHSGKPLYSKGSSSRCEIPGFMGQGGDFKGGNGTVGFDANDQQPLYRSAALSFATDLGWSEIHHRQKLYPPLLPLVRQEIGDPKASDPVWLQIAFENSSAPFQVQIIQISGKTTLQWIYPSDLVQNLKINLERRFGIPYGLQRLIFQGKQLDDPLPLSSYSIKNNSSLVFSLRLRGGAGGQSSSAPPYSYKSVVHSEIPISPESPKPKPFLVDKLEEVPFVEISHSDLASDIQKFAERAIICRFNGLWPRSKDLYDWINDNWTHHCKVCFCSKGYFIVLFDSPKHYEKALEEGPWFMGTAGLFLTPWFSDFDPSSAVITKAPVWIRLANLPTQLWHTAVYRSIGNTLGSFLMGDYRREQQGLYTYARICVELDLSKGLPEQINLKINDSVWTQILDYENTAFRCRHCHLTGHLQNSCPSLPAKMKKGNFAKTKPKRWTPFSPPPAVSFYSSSSEDEESDSEPDQAPQMMDSSTDTPAHTIVTTISQKRIHEASSSESDKEIPLMENSSLQVVLAHTPQDGWIKVNKKKGKKHRVEVTALVG